MKVVCGSSQYYARGLQKAAQQLQGRSELGNEDTAALARAVPGSCPRRDTRSLAISVLQPAA